MCDVHIVGTPTFDDAEARAPRARIDTEDAQLRGRRKARDGSYCALPTRPRAARRIDARRNSARSSVARIKCAPGLRPISRHWNKRFVQALVEHDWA